MRAHGTRAKYTIDLCRCVPCTNANRVYENTRTRMKLYGQWQPFVDVQPVRDHIEALVGAGIGTRRIAELSTVRRSVIQAIRVGKRRAAGSVRPIRQVRAETAHKLFAVPVTTAAVAAGARVPAVGTSRRIHALVRCGWSMNKLAQRIGKTGGNLAHSIEADTVTAETANRVADLYESLWNTPPPSETPQDRAAANRARTQAQTRHWAPPLAWDDDTIDSPDARPKGMRPRETRHLSESA